MQSLNAFWGEPKKMTSLGSHKNCFIYSFVIRNKTGFTYRPLKTTTFRDLWAQAWHSAESKRNNRKYGSNRLVALPNWPSPGSFHPFTSQLKACEHASKQNLNAFWETQKDLITPVVHFKKQTAQSPSCLLLRVSHTESEVIKRQ